MRVTLTWISPPFFQIPEATINPLRQEEIVRYGSNLLSLTPGLTKH